MNAGNALVLEEAGGVNGLKVNLGADERRGLPRSHEVEPVGQRLRVRLSEGQTAVLDLHPEVTLIGLLRVQVVIKDVLHTVD